MREKPLNEPPLLSEIRSLPRRYLRPGGHLDMALVRIDLGAQDEEALKNVLLALYRMDVTIAHHVDARLVRMILARLVGSGLPVTEVPPDRESAWVAGEMYCSGCQGSEERLVFEGGPMLPLCGSDTRIERWENCRKFRENLFAAAADADANHEESLSLAYVNGMLEDFERQADAKIASVSSATQEPV